MKNTILKSPLLILQNLNITLTIYLQFPNLQKYSSVRSIANNTPELKLVLMKQELLSVKDGEPKMKEMDNILDLSSKVDNLSPSMLSNLKLSMDSMLKHSIYNTLLTISTTSEFSKLLMLQNQDKIWLQFTSLESTLKV